MEVVFPTDFQFAVSDAGAKTCWFSFSSCPSTCNKTLSCSLTGTSGGTLTINNLFGTTSDTIVPQYFVIAVENIRNPIYGAKTGDIKLQLFTSTGVNFDPGTGSVTAHACHHDRHANHDHADSWPHVLGDEHLADAASQHPGQRLRVRHHALLESRRPLGREGHDQHNVLG